MNLFDGGLDKRSPAYARQFLAESLIEFTHDPLGHVLFAYPWGVAGTALADETGPDEWQREQLDDIGYRFRKSERTGVYEPVRQARASGHGIGKLSHYNDLAPTPSGMRRWGDLVEGDLLFGVDGAPTRIIQTHHFTDVPMRRVTFDDGSFLDVSTGHLWNVRGRQERRKGLASWRTLETTQIAALGVKRPNGAAMARQWEIPIQGAAQFDRRETELHPYLVGIWLGDGSKGQPQYTKPHPEIANRLRDLGYQVSDHANGKGHRIIGVADRFRSDPVFALGSHERYIPDDYKLNDIAARMALFEGLCDTDGEVHKSGSIGYSTTSLRLAEDVIWLARSLGCKAMMQPTTKIAWYPGKAGERVECRDCYRVTINAPFNPFTHEARRAAYKPSEARYLTRWIESIEPIGNMDGMCVTVEAADGLYQARDFIVTHNSAEVSWLIEWGVQTYPDARGVVTANTDTQLRTKTWAELAKWHGMLHPLLREQFALTATAIYSTAPGHEKTWRIDAIPNSKSNPAAFAGFHNAGKRGIIIFDEASEIDDIIWDTTEGATTDADTEILWAVYGNPTKNTGRFKEVCIGKFRHMWDFERIDSRLVKRTNKALLDSWIAAWGLDSDFVRTRVTGHFPRVGSMQLIGSDVVASARERDIGYIASDALVAGLDVARFGDDASVLQPRRGRDARTIPVKRWRGTDTMTLAGDVALWCAQFNPDALFVDVGGVGAGVYDRLLQLNVRNVFAVNFGGSGGVVNFNGISVKTANKRASMWCMMREWLGGGAIADSPELEADLTGVEYGFNSDDAILLESKQHMKARGLASPDDGDALALTFAEPVRPRAVAGFAGPKIGVSGDYDIHADLR